MFTIFGTRFSVSCLSWQIAAGGKPGLPDGIFSYPKPQILANLEMKFFITLRYNVVICLIEWQF
jgi:hypothetical protein